MKVLLLLFIVFPYKVYSQNIDNNQFTATAYCLQGITKQGDKVARGIIAVDPEVIPLGSLVYIGGSKKVSGYYLASDTGKVIKGSIIDIWMPTCYEARDWGRRKITVIILPITNFKKFSVRRININKTRIKLGPK